MKKNFFSLLAILVTAALVLGGCSSFAADSADIQSITFIQGGSVDPQSSIAYKEITLYPNGTGTLVDYLWQEPGKNESRVANRYDFSISEEAFSSLANTVNKNGFSSLPENMGTFVTDTSASSITVNTTEGSHSSGGVGIYRNGLSPETTMGEVNRWCAVSDAFWKAVEGAYQSDQPASIDSVTCLFLYDPGFWEEIQSGAALEQYGEETVQSIKEGGIWEKTLDSTGKQTVIWYEAWGEMDVNYPRAQAKITSANEYYYNPEGFRQLKQVIEEEGFFSFPEKFEPTDNGEAVELKGAGYCWLTATIDGQTHTSGGVIYEGLANESFLRVYNAYQDATAVDNLISMKKELTIQEALQNWDA